MKKLLVVLLGVLLLLPFSVSAADLKYGMKNNEEVRQVQQYLKDGGYYKGDVTGNFYSVTLAAVKKFQKENKLKVTGIWNQLSQDKKDELLAKNNDVLSQTAEVSNIPVGWIANGDGTFSPPPTVTPANTSVWTPPPPVVYNSSQTNSIVVNQPIQQIVNPVLNVVNDTTPPKVTLLAYSLIQPTPPFNGTTSNGSDIVVFGKSKLTYGNIDNNCKSCLVIKTDKPTTLHLEYLDSFKSTDAFDQKQEYSDKVKILDDGLTDQHIIMLKTISTGWPYRIYFRFSIKDSSGNEFKQNDWTGGGYDPLYDESYIQIDNVKTTY